MIALARGWTWNLLGFVYYLSQIYRLRPLGYCALCHFRFTSFWTQFLLSNIWFFPPFTFLQVTVISFRQNSWNIFRRLILWLATKNRNLTWLSDDAETKIKYFFVWQGSWLSTWHFFFSFFVSMYFFVVLALPPTSTRWFDQHIQAYPTL